MPDYVAVLRRTSIFAAVPDAALQQIAADLEQVELGAGCRVFDAGEAGDCLYIIVAGRVLVHEGDMVLNYLEDGDVFGEMAALDPEPRSASVTAITAVRLLRLAQAPLHDLIAARPEVGLAIIKMLCRHLRARVHDLSHDFVYMQQFALVTAAAQAVETGRYAESMLSEVARRPDELGDLARVFRRMAHEVAAREQQLRQQVQSLQIEIDRAQQARYVKTIVETSYFQELQQAARHLRDELDD